MDRVLYCSCVRIVLAGSWHQRVGGCEARNNSVPETIYRVEKEKYLAELVSEGGPVIIVVRVLYLFKERENEPREDNVVGYLDVLRHHALATPGLWVAACYWKEDEIVKNPHFVKAHRGI